jgi:hypothetical protein
MRLTGPKPTRFTDIAAAIEEAQWLALQAGQRERRPAYIVQLPEGEMYVTQSRPQGARANRVMMTVRPTKRGTS